MKNVKYDDLVVITWWSVLAVPYYCGKANYSVAWTDCVQKPERISVTSLTDDTRKFASSGMIDPTSNMFNDRVFIYHGMNDTLLLPGRTHKLFNFSNQFYIY